MAAKVTKKTKTVATKGQDENLKKMTVKELKERLNAYGLEATGLKPELLKRLETFLTSSMMQTTTNGSGGDGDDGENDLNIETLRDEAKKKAEDAIAKFEMKNKEEDDEDEKPRKRVITEEDHLPTNVAAEEEKKSGKKRGRGGGALASASSSRRRKVRTISESDEEEEEDQEEEKEEEEEEEGNEKKRRRDGGKSKKRRGKKEYEDEDEEKAVEVEYESTKSIPCVGNEGRIIGKGGAKIRELQAKYEVVMQLNRENGCVEIMGDRTNVLECEVEILRIIEEGTARNAEKEKQLQNQGRGGQHHQRGERGGRGEEKRGGGDRGGGGGQGREEIPCAGMEGRIIGKGGETIRRLEADSGARVRINRERLVCEISGEPGCVETAVRLVHELMASSGADRGGGGGQQGRQQQQNVYGGQAFGQQQHQIYGQPAAAAAATTTQVYGAAAATYGQPAASSHVATAVAPVYGQQQQQQYSYGTQQQVYGQATAPTSSAAPVYGQQVYGQQVQQVAPPPVARHHPISSLPPDWEEVNQDGQIYYWNTRTNLTQYERPV